MDLQHFAEEGNEGNNQSEVKTYTEEQVQSMLQSETDKRVTDAIKKREAKFEQELQQRIEAERKEAQRLANLSAEEKEKEMLAKQEQKLKEWERALKNKELLSDTKDILADEGLPTKFADLLLGEDAETTLNKVNDFKSAWQEAIEGAINDRLKGKTPKSTQQNDKTPLSNEVINRMSDEEYESRRDEIMEWTKNPKQ